MKDGEKCTECGLCLEHCRFGAITPDYDVSPEKCEGCGVCAYVCPAGALRLAKHKAGLAYASETRYGPMAHARLFTAEEASGKLVTLVRRKARSLAEEHGKDRLIIDGPPGIGCPVIAAITGVDLVLIVTEPTLSGIHDMERVLGVTEHFSVPALVCINKYDINEENAERIEQMCEDGGVEMVGKLSYDEVATEAMVAETPVVRFSEGRLARTTEKVWGRVRSVLDGK